MFRPLWLAASVLLFTLTPAADAAAKKKARFGGPHPLSPDAGSGMCFLEVPHTHSYEPDDVDVLYVQSGGTHVFVGDPTAYDVEHAPRHGYYGHHPVTWADGDPYCYLSGPHHHWYAPRSAVGFTTHDGLSWYVGDHPSWYRTRVRERAYVDAYYVGMPIMRVSVNVAPPVGFFGFYVRGPWVHDRVAWYSPKGKGPPPWAPAWGHRGKHAGKKWKHHSFVKHGGHGGAMKHVERGKYGGPAKGSFKPRDRYRGDDFGARRGNVGARKITKKLGRGGGKGDKSSGGKRGKGGGSKRGKGR